MRKVNFHWNFAFDIEIETDKKVDVYIDQFDPSIVPKDTIRIVILWEPKWQSLLDLVNTHPDSYTYVLTYYQDILDNNPKSRYFTGTATWIDPNLNYPKKFCVSTVVGGKNNPIYEGYAMRHNLWRKQHEIIVPKNFYLSDNFRFNEVDYSKNLILTKTPFPNKKEMMFDCMFHVAIENTSIINWFTEKIVDCFISKTIPIYYGDTNIGSHFNSEGILEVRNIGEIISICNRMTPEIYYSKLIAIEDNYQRSLKYQNSGEILKNAIIKLIR
jgi:hypothetical protein